MNASAETPFQLAARAHSEDTGVSETTSELPTGFSGLGL